MANTIIVEVESRKHARDQTGYHFNVKTSLPVDLVYFQVDWFNENRSDLVIGDTYLCTVAIPFDDLNQLLHAQPSPRLSTVNFPLAAHRREPVALDLRPYQVSRYGSITAAAVFPGVEAFLEQQNRPEPQKPAAPGEAHLADRVPRPE